MRQNALRQYGWSPKSAYLVGLITSDGSLSKDERHISFSSKDIEQIENFLACLENDVKVSRVISGSAKSESYRVQWSDVHLYQILKNIGLTPNKSLTIKTIRIEDDYFAEFVRGYFDGDGSVYEYYDKRYPDSQMVYLSFCSGSEIFLSWLRKELQTRLGIMGHVIKASEQNSCFQLRYAKNESRALAQFMYKNNSAPRLSRKYLKISSALGIVTAITEGN